MTCVQPTADDFDKILAHDSLPPALIGLYCCRSPFSAGTHPRKPGSPPATVGAAPQTTSSPTLERPQIVLDCPAKAVGRAGEGHSSWLSRGRSWRGPGPVSACTGNGS